MKFDYNYAKNWQNCLSINFGRACESKLRDPRLATWTNVHGKKQEMWTRDLTNVNDLNEKINLNKIKSTSIPFTLLWAKFKEVKFTKEPISAGIEP